MVLILDDEMDLLEIFSECLAIENVSSVGCQNYLDAQKVIRNVRVKTLLVDHGVYSTYQGHVDALIMLGEIKNVVLMTGDHSIEKDSNPIASKCLRVFHKPMNITELALYLKSIDG